MRRNVVIGSRGSQLALWQANDTRDKLAAAGYDADIRVIKTKGDAVQHLGFDKLEGKGFFTKEIEDALLAGEIDLAVHSCKDLPSVSPEGLVTAGYSSRASSMDVLLVRPDRQDPGLLFRLPHHARVGTSSARRKAQLLSFRPDVRVVDIRGNVPTRVGKLAGGDLDAIMLAAAGLDRLELDTGSLVRVELPPHQFVPAPAQGVLAYQVRAADKDMKAIVSILDDRDASQTVGIERNLLAAFGGGCQVPLGIHALRNGSGGNLWVSWASAWNAPPRRVRIPFGEHILDPEKIAKALQSPWEASVFISTRLGEEDHFHRLLASHGLRVTARSLLDIRPVLCSVVPGDHDWVFFSSRNAVRYFFRSVGRLPEKLKLAAVNSGTADELTSRGHQVHFTGQGGDMDAIATAFDAIPSGERVLFPRAMHSRRSVQKRLRCKKATDVVVYENTMSPEVPVQEEDILVFTSPMNAENYLQRHRLTDRQRLVAIGDTTAAAIRGCGHTCSTAFEPTRVAMADEVMRLVSRLD